MPDAVEARDRVLDFLGDLRFEFGRRGARPLNTDEIRRLYLDATGEPWYVSDSATEQKPSAIVQARGR